MRPPEFTGGKFWVKMCATPSSQRFNEAAGIHRRKAQGQIVLVPGKPDASMRPPEFTGGKAHGPPRQPKQEAVLQ